jgi:preprotein translocase subunit SecE
MADLATTGSSGAQPGLPSRAVSFYNGVLAEMKRVTWPDLGQVRSATIAIIIFVLIIALLITMVDGVLQALLIKLLPSLFAR